MNLSLKSICLARLECNRSADVGVKGNLACLDSLFEAPSADNVSAVTNAIEVMPTGTHVEHYSTFVIASAIILELVFLAMAFTFGVCCGRVWLYRRLEATTETQSYSVFSLNLMRRLTFWQKQPDYDRHQNPAFSEELPMESQVGDDDTSPIVAQEAAIDDASVVTEDETILGETPTTAEQVSEVNDETPVVA